MADIQTLQFPLSVAQLDAYERDGFVIERRVFASEEVLAIAGEAESLRARNDLIDSNNLRCRWQNHVETGECLFETFDPVIDLSRPIADMALGRRILDRLASIYGEEGALFKDKLILKPPGATGYDMHQDYIGWRDFPKSFITVQIAIDAADFANGCTEVFPGYHHRGYLSPLDGQYHPLPPGTVDESAGVKLDLQPGDLAIFGCFTPHRSSPNRSRRWRRQLYLSYNAHSDGGQQRDKHYEEFHRWLKEKYAQHGRHNVYFR